MIPALSFVESIILALALGNSLLMLLHLPFELKIVSSKEYSVQFYKLINLPININNVLLLFLFVLIGYNLFIFGILDSNNTIFIEYAFKLLLLTILSIVIFIKPLHMLKKLYTTSIEVSIWSFITFYQFYILIYSTFPSIYTLLPTYFLIFVSTLFISFLFNKFYRG